MRAFSRGVIAVLALSLVAAAETKINGSRTILGGWDASGAMWSKPAKTGTTLPATCSAGEQFFKMDAAAGANLYLCTGTDTWTQMSGGGTGGTDFGPQSANTIFAGPASGVAAAPSFRSLTAADLPAPVTGAALPATCSLGQEFFLTTVSSSATGYYKPGKYVCIKANTWSMGDYEDAEPWYLAPWGTQDTQTIGPGFANLATVYAQAFTVRETAKISKLTVTVNYSAPGTSATTYLTVGIADAGKNLLTSGYIQGLNTALGKTISFPAPITLTPGVYFLLYASDDTAMRLTANASIGQVVINGGAFTYTRFGVCANGATGGSGSPVVLPAACGDLISDSGYGPFAVALKP